MEDTHACLVKAKREEHKYTHANLCCLFLVFLLQPHMECAHICTSIDALTFLGLRRQAGLLSPPKSCARRWHLLLKDIIYFTLGLSSQQQTECFHQCDYATIALAAAQPHLCLSPPDTARAVQEPILKAEAQRRWWQHCGNAALNEITGCEGRERVAKSSRTIKRKVISLRLSAELRCGGVCTSPCACLF